LLLWTICTWMSVTFLQISRKPNIDLELDCIFGKSMKRRFRRYIVHMEILSTFYIRVEYISVQEKMLFCPFKPMGEKSWNSPFLWGTWTHLIHPSFHWHHSPPQTTARSVHTLPHKYTSESPLITMGCPKFTPKLTLPLWRSPPLSNTPTHRPAPLTIPNGIWIHSSVLPQISFRTDRQTDRPTDGLGEWSVWILRTLAVLIAMRW